VAKGYLPYDIDQRLLLPPDMRSWLPEGHLALFILDVVAELDLSRIAVDEQAQVIVAAELTQSANDARQLVPMARAIVENVGKLAETTSADAGYFSREAVAHPALEGTNLLVPPSRQKHGAVPNPGSADPAASAAQRMRHKLASVEAQALYKMRKAIVEPVFGQIKEVRGLRRVLLRGFAAARAEFLLIALSHNLLKLFRLRNPVAVLPA